MMVQSGVDVEVMIDRQSLKYDISTVDLKQYADDHHVLIVRLRELGTISDTVEIKTAIDYTRFLGKSITLNLTPSTDVIDASLKLEFIGIVTSVYLENSIDSVNAAVIVAHSPTITLDGARKNVYYVDKSAEDIIGSIIRAYPVSCGSIDRTAIVYSFTVQYRETDYEAIKRYGSDNGLFTVYDGKEFRAIKAAAVDETALTWRETLGSFSIGLGTAPYQFNARVYNYDQKKYLDQDTSSISSSRALSTLSRVSPAASSNIYKDSGFAGSGMVAPDKQSLDKILGNMRNQAMGSMITCTGQSNVPTVTTGHSIGVTGMGDKFDGSYFVTRVHHVVDESGLYGNTFTCVPVDIAYPKPYSARPVVTNLQSAVVTDNQDPDKLGRVTVKFPWLDGDTPWLRVVSPGAGKDRGTFWLPEVDDEVLCAYEHGCVDRPIVLGSLYNKKDAPASDTANNKNDIKIISTKSGNKLVFDDSYGKQKIGITVGDSTIEIAAGNTPTINLTSGGDFGIECKGTLKITADSIDIKSNADFKAKAGANAKIEASANGDVKAGGMLKLQGMTTDVKGTPIKLN